MKANEQEIFNALLMLCFSDSHHKKYASIVDQGIQSDSFFIDHFRALPYLYKHVDKELFSEKSWKKCAGIYKHTLYRNRILLDRAAKVQTWLANYVDAPFILLKGAGLALGTYEDIGERPMSDIDFFLPNFPIESDELNDSMKENENMSLLGDSVYAVTYIDQQKFEYDFHRFVNLHAISEKFSELCIRHSKYVNYLNNSFGVLCPEHQFVHVVYHGILSPGVAYSKRWIFDALQLLKVHDLSADTIIELANHLDIPRAFLKGVAQLQALPEELRIDKELLGNIKNNVKKKSFFYAWVHLLKSVPDAADSAPVSRVDWCKGVFSFFIIKPIRWRKIISIRKHYQKTFFQGVKSKSIFESICKRIARGSFYLLFGRWSPRKK